MDYVAYEVTITAIPRSEGSNAIEHRPSAIAYIDLSSGDPILVREGRTSAPGVSTTEAWDGLDLNRLIEALPGASTAPRLESAPPGIEPPQIERRRCPSCGRKVEMARDGWLVRHNDKPVGGKPCSQGSAPGKRTKWPPAPADVVHLFETKYGRSYVALGKAYGVPAKTAGNWVASARARAAKRKAEQEELADLPIHDPGSDSPQVTAPADILEIFAKKFNNSYTDLIKAYGIPITKAYSWVNDARRKAKKAAAQSNTEDKEAPDAEPIRPPTPRSGSDVPTDDQQQERQATAP